MFGLLRPRRYRLCRFAVAVSVLKRRCVGPVMCDAHLRATTGCPGINSGASALRLAGTSAITAEPSSSSPPSVVRWPPNARRAPGRGALAAAPETPLWRFDCLFLFPRSLVFDPRFEFSCEGAEDASGLPFRAGASPLAPEGPSFGFGLGPLPPRPPRRPWLFRPLDDPCDGVCDGLP